MNNVSRRDYFSAMAMQGMLHTYKEEWSLEILAHNASLLADALITELDKNKEIPKKESCGTIGQFLCRLQRQ